MGGDRQIPGCFKYGCVGCLTLLAIGVGLVFLFGAVQLGTGPHEPRPVERRVERDLPAPPRAPLPPEAPMPGEDAPAVPDVLPLPETPEIPIGRVVVDLRMGDFSIRAGPPDQPIRVEADFDDDAFELSENFKYMVSGAWEYEIGFGSRGGFLGQAMRGESTSHNRVEIVIPRGRPVELLGAVALGELDADLSGLWLHRIDLDLGAGDHFFEFREPAPEALESFRLEASVGSVEVRGLGEASPRTVAVSQRIGELFLDLRGGWRNDATVDVDFFIGECRLWVPEDARVDVRRASIRIGEASVPRPRQVELPPGAPTLTIDVESTIGEIDVDY